MGIFIKVIIILWHSALVVIPYFVCRSSVRREFKSTEKKLGAKELLLIFGQCLFMASILTVWMFFGRSASIPYYLISLASALTILFVAMLLFGLPMRGSWLVLLGTISLYLIGALGLGLLVSSIADTQQVAFQVAVLASFLPTLMLSGFIFPIASMPPFLQGVTYIVPARYFLIALRGIVLKGAGLSIIWPQLLSLVAYSCVVLLLASLRLRRQWR